MPETNPGQVEVIGGFLTSQDLIDSFGIADLTLIAWRKEQDLPYVLIPGRKRGAIRYRRPRVIKWAKQHGKTFVKPLPHPRGRVRVRPKE